MNPSVSAALFLTYRQQHQGGNPSTSLEWMTPPPDGCRTSV
ncbi:hypothetical protein CRUP_012542 [Coryphaenoides rupestris]|nr:hypothetical protein CRUP_012542 [Coryphaenoides rupestris]